MDCLEAGVPSSYSVPIRVKGQWLGLLCLNDCREAIETGSAEVTVLRSIADLLAIEPDLNRFLDYVLKAFTEQFDDVCASPAGDSGHSTNTIGGN